MEMVVGVDEEVEVDSLLGVIVVAVVAEVVDQVEEIMAVVAGLAGIPHASISMESMPQIRRDHLLVLSGINSVMPVARMLIENVNGCTVVEEEIPVAVAVEMDVVVVKEVVELLVRLWFNKMVILVPSPHVVVKVEPGLDSALMDRVAILRRRDEHATRKQSIYMNEII
jgi:hypothetical protein